MIPRKSATRLLHAPRFAHAPLMLIALLATAAFAGAPTTQPITGPDNQPLIFHLPGIGGHRLPDEMLKRGLLGGGIDAEFFIYDWTGEDEGIIALTNTRRHDEQSTLIAEMLTQVARAQPARRIILTCHSAGGGIAAYALEKLPDDIHIDTWLLIAPALSPDYDLTPALRHVRRAYHFYSGTDPILGFGTRTFGTVDRVKTDSAGKVGFTRPPAGGEAEYARLRQFPYNPAWLRLGNAGDHIGGTMTPFARRIIAPLLLSGQLPAFPPPTTSPTAVQTPAAGNGAN